jgi:hypothetical protein
MTTKTKLVLARETLQRLDGTTLEHVRGGAGDPRTSKPTGNGKPPSRNCQDDPSCYIGPCCNG